MVSIYDMFGVFQSSFQMGQEAKEMKIIDTTTFASSTGTGLVVLTTNYRFFVVNNVKEPRIRRFPDIPGEQTDSPSKEKHLIDSLRRNQYCTELLAGYTRRRQTNKTGSS